MMEGARIICCFRVPVRPGSRRHVVVDEEYRVAKFKAVLPEGPTASGGYREEPLLQFYAREGGLRTIAKSTILDIV